MENEKRQLVANNLLGTVSLSKVNASAECQSHQSQDKHVNDGEGLAGVLLHVGVLVLDFHQRVAQNKDSNTFHEEHLSLGRILRVNLAVHANA